MEMQHCYQNSSAAFRNAWRLPCWVNISRIYISSDKGIIAEFLTNMEEEE